MPLGDILLIIHALRGPDVVFIQFQFDFHGFISYTVMVIWMHNTATDINTSVGNTTAD